MAPLSLKAAAKQSGVAKTTLLRSIRNGRLSASKDDLGSWSIDPAELFRDFPPKSADPEDPGTNGGSVVQNGPVAEPPSIEAWTRLASLQAKVEALEALVQRLDRDKQDLQVDRDTWRDQARQLALPKPEPAPPKPEPARGWRLWPWSRTT